DRFGNRLDRAHNLDRMGDDVDRAAALHARRLVGIEHFHRDVDADDGAFRDAEEVHVHRQILNRIELEVARNHPVLGTVHVDVKQRGEKAPGIDAPGEFGMVERDHLRGFVLAVNHARHSAERRAARAAPLPPFGRTVAFNSWTVAMVKSSSKPMEKAAFSAACERGKPPGVPGAAVARVYSGAGRKGQESPKIQSAEAAPAAFLPALASSASIRALSASFSSRAR